MTCKSLIGRIDELEWLKKTPGDLLLSGQPGSGKTFLFYKLAKENDALFVIDKNVDLITQGIRSQKPAILMIDDAHISKDLITTLKHFRQTTNIELKIIANCWSGEEEEVKKYLNISNSNVRELQLLTRDEIVEVIKETGIIDSDGLLVNANRHAG